MKSISHDIFMDEPTQAPKPHGEEEVVFLLFRASTWRRVKSLAERLGLTPEEALVKALEELEKANAK